MKTNHLSVVEIDNTRHQMLQAVTSDVQQANLVAPAGDSDQRSRKVWTVIKNHPGPYSASFVADFDYTLLAPTDGSFMTYFQVRDNSDLESRVESNIIKFYGKDSEDLKRSPIIFKFLDDNGEVCYYATMGWGRGYAFRKKKDKKPAIIIDCTKMPLNEVLQFAFMAASRSNESDNDEVDNETRRDVIQQCRTLIELEEKLGATMSQDEKIKMCDEFLLSKYSYSKQEHGPTRADIINMALEIGRAAPLPMPDDDILDREWKRAFNGNSFDVDNKTNVLKIINNGYFQDIRRAILNHWSTRSSEEVSKVRKPCWLALRVGSCESTQKSITSIDTVKSKRRAMIKSLTEFNVNANHKFGGVPLVKRVLFVKQLDFGADYEAWEWNEDMEQFDKIGTPSQIPIDF